MRSASHNQPLATTCACCTRRIWSTASDGATGCITASWLVRSTICAPPWATLAPARKSSRARQPVPAIAAARETEDEAENEPTLMHVVVIGGSDAGISAALRVRELRADVK